MASIVDNIFFQDLSAQDPAKVCRRAQCQYDNHHRCYIISLWGEAHRIYPHEARIEPVVEPRVPFPEYFDLFMVHYLLHAQATKMDNAWISEKDIPGGTTFFRGPHAIPTHLVADRFDNQIVRFQEQCTSLKGTSLDMADAAFVFQIVPRIPVAVLYWARDDEFPTETKLLYDRSIAHHLALDIIYALSVGTCQRIAAPLAPA